MFKLRWWNFIRIYIKSLNLGDLLLMAWSLLAWMNLRDYL